MANFPSLSIIAATVAPWTLPATTLTTTTTMTTPTIPTATSTIYTPTTPIPPTISIPTAPGSPQNLPSFSVNVQNTQGDCLPQAPGYGPIPSEDTIFSFYSSLQIRAPALSASTPYGYSLAFQGAKASYVGTKYLGFYELEAYSATECASRCLSWGISAPYGEPSALSTAPFPDGFDSSAAPTYTPIPRTQVCNSFNIYFERSPAIHLGPECKDADSRTIIKCALWGEGDMQEKGATNTGYKEWNFEVVIAGSNGYRYGEYEYGDVKKSEGEKSVAPDRTMEIVKRVSLGVVVVLLVAGVMGF